MSLADVREDQWPRGDCLLGPWSFGETFGALAARRVLIFMRMEIDRAIGASAGMLGEPVHAIAAEVSRTIAPEIARITLTVIQPALLTVKLAATYIGRLEQAVQQMVFRKDLPVVRSGRLIHIREVDLDK